MLKPDLTLKARLVHQELVRFYGLPAPRERQDPLSELIQTILSQNTSDLNTARSFSALKLRFPSWEDVLEADSEAVIEAIHVGGLARIKGPRIQAILRQIYQEQGQLSLENLRTMPTHAVKNYLTGLHGIGPKTAACVLLFSLGKPALPVDTHVHRVSLRLGLVPLKTNAEKTQELLESYLPEQDYYSFHMNMIHHGRTLCAATKPKCLECPLAALCDYVHLHVLDTQV
jgi:endonuclease-3